MIEKNENLDLKPFQVPENGWEPGMQSSIQLFITNPTAVEANLTHVDYCFLVDGEASKYTGSFAGYVEMQPYAETAQEYCPVTLPQELVDSIEGQKLSLFVKAYGQAAEQELVGEATIDINFTKATAPMKTVSGEYIALELRQEQFEGIERAPEMVKYLDEAYLAMAELTGQKPENGLKMALRESPALGYYARAGFPILLNSQFVRTALTDFEKGSICYPWLHEIGHNFEYGYWYMYNSGACEFHANFKLIYVVEQTFATPRADFKLYKWDRATQFGKTYATGKEWVDQSFLKREIDYLKDQSRDWTSLDSDELQFFYMSMVREHGWEPFKKMYRTYRSMNANGVTKPTENWAEEMMGLQMTILYLSIGADVLKRCQEWRIPLTQEKTKYFIEKYKLNNEL